MIFSVHRRSVRAAAGFAALAMPFGLAFPAVASEAPDSAPAIVLPADETPASVRTVDTQTVEADDSGPVLGSVDTQQAVESDDSDPALDSLDSQIEPEADDSDEVLSSIETQAIIDQYGTPASAPAAAAATAVANLRFFLNDRWTGAANTEFTWGDASYKALAGDWDGNGKDTVALRQGNRFAFSNERSPSGTPQFTFTFGSASDTILVGDWNGDGKDTLAIRSGNTFKMKNSLTGTGVDTTITFGRADDEVFVGDWDGNGTDTLAVRRGNLIHISNVNLSSKTDKVISYGRVGDDLYVGSFDAAHPGKDSFAVRRGKTYFINKTIKSGYADIQLDYGRINDVTLLGDWNGDGQDTLGVVRTVSSAASTPADSDASKQTSGADILAFALQFEGTPYVWNGKSPAGWDCVNMVRYVYKHYGVTIGYPGPVQVLKVGREVPYSEAKPGDILYWPAERTMLGQNDHTALYIDATTNFGAGRSKGTAITKTKWKGEPPTVIRVFE